jgi:hypothetical protein
VIKADLYFGTNDANGADGMALVFQPNCTGEGSDGGGIGYQGVTPSLGFEFDTWQNTNYSDPQQDHLGIQKNGNVNHSSADALLPKSELVMLGNIEDGKYHNMVFSFDAKTRAYSLSFDGKVLLRSKAGQDLFKDVFGEIHHFFWGVTAATGAATNDQKVKLIEIPHHDAYPYKIVYPTEETGGKGSITMSIVNGKDPFTYQWLPDQSWTLEPTKEGIEPGLYTVIAKDRVGCVSEFKFRIPTMPNLIGHWTFEYGKELKDLTGNFDDLELKGAKVSNGALDVGKDAWARALNYRGDDFTEKTLMAWVKLDDLNMGGGSALSVDSDASFDGIVYAERQAKRWMSGSDFFKRSDNPNPGFEEKETGKLVKMAITYKLERDQCQVTIYRNNEMIGQYTKGALPSYKKGIEALFGIRHSVKGAVPGNPWMDAKIEEARIYDGVLTLPQIKSVQFVKPEYLAEVKEKTVVLGDRIWMTENISTTTCQNGNPIDPSNYKKTDGGVLYNPNAVEECNVCPKGWRLATKEDFKMLGDKGFTKEQVVEALNINSQSLKPSGYLRIDGEKVYYNDMASIIKGGSFTTKGDKNNFHPVRCVGDIKDLNPDAAPVELVNVAVGKTATQSSTDYKSPASNAVNDVTHGKYAANGAATNDITHTTASQKNPWWQVDLGAVYDIRKIVVWNRRDCCWERLKNFHIMVSESPITDNSTSANQFSNGPHAFTQADHASMTIEGNKKGRYVRLFINGNGPLSLAELQVFAVK